MEFAKDAMKENANWNGVKDRVGDKDNRDAILEEAS